jgi:hypothetical protein
LLYSVPGHCVELARLKSIYSKNDVDCAEWGFARPRSQLSAIPSLHNDGTLASCYWPETHLLSRTKALASQMGGGPPPHRSIHRHPHSPSKQILHQPFLDRAQLRHLDTESRDCTLDVRH